MNPRLFALSLLLSAFPAFGQTELSELPALSTLADADLFLVTDASDTSASADGTSKSVLFSVLKLHLQPFDADLTTYAAITPSANVQTLLGAATFAAFKTSLSLNLVENTALSTWAGSANLTTLGTIGTGIWQGTIIGPTFLGTGSSITTKYLRGDGTWQSLAAGTGSMTTVKANGVQVGDADIVALDFSTDFGVAETPDTEINLTIAAGITRDTEWDTLAEIETAIGGLNILLETEIDASSELLALMDDETGSGVLVFATSPTIASPTFSGTIAGTYTLGGAPTFPDNGIALGTKTTGNYVADVVGTANEITSTHTPGEGSTATLSLPAAIDLGGKTSFELPNAAAPTVSVFGQIAGDNNLWAASRGTAVFFDGTDATAFVNPLVSDTPTNGQVPTWNTGGTITWETPSGGSSLTDTFVGFGSGANALTGEAAFAYNATTNTLTVENVSSSGTQTIGVVNTTTFQIGGVGVTASAAELNFVDGVTSAIQTQIDAKQATMSGGTNGVDLAGATINLDLTEIAGSQTFGDASTDTIVWTFNRATGTDPTVTFNSGSIGLQALTLGTDLAVTEGGTGASSLNDLITLSTHTTGNYAAGDAEAGGATKLRTAAGSSTLSAGADIAMNTTDKQIGVHNGTKEVAIPLVYHREFTFDPKAVCDGAVDRLFLFKIGAWAPKGITVTGWRVSFEADPTTEVDLDLKRADAFIGVANSAVMDVLDTTAGASSETVAANINAGAVVANGKVMYLEFGTAYSETTHQVIVELEYEIEED